MSAWETTDLLARVREFSSRGLNLSYLPVPCDMESILKAVETALKIPRAMARPDAGTPQVVADTELESWFQRGEKYRLGRNVPKDYTKALKWYRKEAEQGNAKAQECGRSIFNAWYGYCARRRGST